MYCSNCGAEAKGNFCSRCGSKIEELVKSNQCNILQKTEGVDSKPSIIIRSENCTDLVEERKKATEKTISQTLCAISVGAVLFMCSPAIYALIENKKLSQVDALPLPVILITMAILVSVCLLFSRLGKKFAEVYNKYKQYCATEVLIVEETKIYGSTSRGSLTLTYEQIGSVSFSPNVYSPGDKTPVIPNDIFTVRDIVGNVFTFYSFKNCKDLKVVIDAKLKGN